MAGTQFFEVVWTDASAYEMLWSAANFAPEAIEDTLEIGLTLAWSRLPPAPPMPEKGSFVFVSDKQRRFVMAQIREGNITVPRIRTNTMLREFHVTTKQFGGPLVVGYLGTPVVYAPWVISDKEVPGRSAGPQARIHKDRWWTLQEHMKAMKDDMFKLMQSTIAISLKRRKR